MEKTKITKRAFTLVELLAVIVILAIILVIAVPQIMDTIEKSKKGSMESSAKLVASEVELKYNAALTTGDTFNTTGSCISYGNLDTDEYDTCTYTITNGKAKVTLKGKTGGKFDGYTCTDATKIEATCTKGSSNQITVKNSFADYTWEEIKTLVDKAEANEITYGDLKTTYNLDVGQERSVSLAYYTPYANYDEETETFSGGYFYFDYNVRISNMSKPIECSSEGFSESACGFVVEFSEVVGYHAMNSTNTNVGGWASSSMRTYLNDEFYNMLPSDLQSVIADTTVVSGHGYTSGETNFTTTDKLYLLSLHEVFEETDDDTSSGIDYYDTAYNNTRQLDYYKNKNITIGAYDWSLSKYDGNYIDTIKKFGEDNEVWWLRSTNRNMTGFFYAIDDDNGWYMNQDSNAYGPGGVSPAFRIA